MTIRNTGYGDYRVNFKGGPEAHAVYEVTVRDALDTAEAMWAERHREYK